MPVMNGFQLIEALAGRHQPYIIFTTAYDNYAIRAFEVNAIGYLLKPFEQEKFAAAVNRFIREYGTRQQQHLYDNLDQLLQQQAARPEYLQRVLIREKQKMFYVPLSEVLYFESAGDYIKVVCASKSYLLYDSLSAMESRLDPMQFARVHRSLLVHAAQVREFVPYTNGEYTLVMQNGDNLKTSRHYRPQLTRIFKEL
jgi:two-component system LytT family response regulator